MNISSLQAQVELESNWAGIGLGYTTLGWVTQTQHYGDLHKT